jgi:hypothetical protein
MKKFAALSVAAALFALSFGTSIATPAPTLKQPTCQTGTSWLYVVSAGSGKIKPAKTPGEYVVSMNLPDINQVTMFSDRPKRIVKIITGKDLRENWSTGSNSFSTDSPNAVLSATSLHPLIVELTQIKTQKNTITVRFKPLQKTKPIGYKVLRKLVLTIDSDTQETTSSDSTTSCSLGYIYCGRSCTCISTISNIFGGCVSHDSQCSQT